jgi:hypothetical protein
LKSNCIIFIKIKVGDILSRIAILEKWFTYQNREKISFHEQKRYDSFGGMITRLVQSTDMGHKEFKSTKSLQEIKFWQINENLLTEMRPYEIFEHSGQWFGDWSQAYFSEKTGAAIEFKLPEIYLAFHEKYREEYFQLARYNNLNTFIGIKDGKLEHFSKKAYDFSQSNHPNEKLLEKSSNTDLVKIDEDTIYFLELKKRIDTGGGGAKQELKDKAKKIITSIFRNDIVWHEEKEDYRILDILIKNNIKKVKIGFGIFFKKSGKLYPDDYKPKKITHQKQLFNEVTASFPESEESIEKSQDILMEIYLGGEKSFKIPIIDISPLEKIHITVEYLYGNKPFQWFIGDTFKMDSIEISENWIDFEYTIDTAKKERALSLKNSKYEDYNNFSKIIKFLKKSSIQQEKSDLLGIANNILLFSKSFNENNKNNPFTLDSIDEVICYIHMLIVAGYLEFENNLLKVKKEFSK